MREIKFSENALKVTNETLRIAANIWGECKWHEVSFAAGYAAYGKFYAMYHRQSHIVEMSVNPSFEKMVYSAEGFEIAEEHGYIGTLLHELGHHATPYAPAAYPNTGGSTHDTVAWCWICVQGWNHFFPGNGLTVERLYRAAHTFIDPDTKKKVGMDGQSITGHLACFHPNENPAMVVKLVDFALNYKPKKTPIFVDDRTEEQKFIDDRHQRGVCLKCGEMFERKRRSKLYCKPACKVAYLRAIKKSLLA